MRAADLSLGGGKINHVPNAPFADDIPYRLGDLPIDLHDSRIVTTVSKFPAVKSGGERWKKAKHGISCDVARSRGTIGGTRISPLTLCDSSGLTGMLIRELEMLWDSNPTSNLSHQNAREL